MLFLNQFLEFSRSADAACRVRFAPTPSGYLHVGNALNFTLNWLVARRVGGKILLRIDDLDAERTRPEYVADIFESLEWLGLDWDEGPASTRPTTLSRRTSNIASDFEKNWSQHRRLPLYFKVLEKLRATSLLFACRKSRRDLAPFGGDYPPEFRNQNCSLDDPEAAWRIRTPLSFGEGSGMGLPDFVVRRRDGIPAYQVASLADDLHFGVTHVVRGADLEASTAAQRYLAECLGETNFLKIKFLHHPLVTDERGEKFSKSAGASSLKALREGGARPEIVFQQVAKMLNFPEVASAFDLLEELKMKAALP
jgi:glutamyl-tRNA synthetase